MILLIMWFMNPGLTEMQLFLKYWYCTLVDVGIVFSYLYIKYLIEYKKTNSKDR